jgi:S-(hydroxymethyl)glutathione dehydrogenase / alcohol dehydrogenase
MVRAAVLSAPGEPLRVTDLELPDPGPGQVRVQIAATGVCHSDLSLANGMLLQPMPVVLGHEAAGTVAQVGEGVSHLSVGDRVVLCWAPPCGECWFCLRSEVWLCERSSEAAGRTYARADGQDVFPGLSTAGFAEQTVVAARAAVRVPDEVPLEQAALVGCAVLTGVGAVLNAARVRPGESVLVVGVGGVGLSVVQGARLAEAGQVIAVDRSPDKLALAQRMGATDVLEAGGELARQVRALTGGRGTDHAFDCVGTAQTIRSSWSATRRGGVTTVVGIGSRTEQVAFSPVELFHFARRLQGCIYGNADPFQDIPRLLRFAAEGRLDLDALIDRRIPLEGIGEAFAAMERGEGARAVVVP